MENVLTGGPIRAQWAAPGLPQWSLQSQPHSHFTGMSPSSQVQGIFFGTTIIERYRCRERTVEETLIEMLPVLGMWGTLPRFFGTAWELHSHAVPGCAIWPAPSGATRSIWVWSVWRFSLRMSPLLANFIYSGGYEQFAQISWHCPGWWSGRFFRVKFTEDSLKLDAVTGAGESMHIR